MKKICGHWSFGILAVFFLLIGCFVYAQPSLDSVVKSPAGDSLKVATTKAHIPAAEITDTAKQAADNSEKRLMFYLSETIGFYKWMLTLLLSVIAAVLAIGYYFSTKKAEEMAHKALKEESFQLLLEKRIQERLTKLFNDSNLATVETSISELNNKIVGLEKQISEKSYKIVDTEGGEA